MRKGQALTVLLLVFLWAGAALGEPLGITSNDMAIELGQWRQLVKRYPMPYYGTEAPLEAPEPETLAQWWSALGDATLTELILTSLEDNREMTMARSRFAEARARLGIAKSTVLPWLSGTGTLTNIKSGENASMTGRQIGPIDLYSLKMDASWEIDFFGKRKHAIRGAAQDLQAQYGALHNAWVGLSSEVALHYISLRTLQKQLLVAEKNLKLQEETLELMASQFDSGLADELALSQAQYRVEQTRSTIPPLHTSLERTMNILALLTGQVPGSLQASLDHYVPLTSVRNINLVGIPADFLRQRPDIYQAERTLAAQISKRKSAEKAYLPTFSLFGSLGLESYSSGGDLLESESSIFRFGPTISWPIFNGGSIRKNIQVQTEKEKQALANYEQTVLRAVGEVRNALTAEVQERKRNESLHKGVEAAKTAEEVAENQFSNGLTSFNDVIAAQGALLDLEGALALSDGERMANLVRLFKALGGGWAPMEEYSMVQKRKEPQEKKGKIELSQESETFLENLRQDFQK